MFFGQNVKIFASHRQMKSEPDLTCWQASDKKTDLLMNGIMQSKPKCPLPSTHQKLQVSCTEIYSVFFLIDEEFVSKSINDSNIDLDKFPASDVRQLAKKMESSISTPRHIKAVASDPQVAQVNLLSHQRTDLQPCKSKWKHSNKHRSESEKALQWTQESKTTL